VHSEKTHSTKGAGFGGVDEMGLIPTGSKLQTRVANKTCRDSSNLGTSIEIRLSISSITNRLIVSSINR